MKKLLIACPALALILFSSGCVTGRRMVDLPVSKAAPLVAPSKGTVAIGSIVDARHFENKPSDPSIPSINGDVTTLSADQRAAFIGRQRNTYGHAMGDIVLPSGDTVQARVKELLIEGFARHGYTVATDATGKDAADVTIDQFWAWFTPGMWSVDFEARVYCTFTVHRGQNTQTFTVKGYGMNHGQVARDANWRQAYSRAFEDFLSKFDQELTKAGF